MEVLVDNLNAKIGVSERKWEETPRNFQNVLSEHNEIERVYDCKLCDFKSAKNYIWKRSKETKLNVRCVIKDLMRHLNERYI